MAADIRAGRRLRIDRVGLGEPKDTTHVAVIDRDGNAVTMTHTLGMPSGVITDGLGFMYNGAMSVFDPRPGRPGSVAPGKSRFSAICPTLVFGSEGLRAAIGAPGGAQIAIGVMQGLVNLLEFGMSMSDAVAAPRFSATSHIIDVTMRIPTFVTDELERDGYTIARNPNTFDVAAVHGIEVRPDGTSTAAPTRGTMGWRWRCSGPRSPGRPREHENRIDRHPLLRVRQDAGVLAGGPALRLHGAGEGWLGDPA